MGEEEEVEEVRSSNSKLQFYNNNIGSPEKEEQRNRRKNEEEKEENEPQAKVKATLTPTPNNNSTLSYSKLRFQNLTIATSLIITYLIEITLQIFLIIHAFAFFSSSSSFSQWSWNWPSFLTVTCILSSLLVTTLSLLWVFRGLDFAGRFCGRLLCYVMHSLLLGLFWRYLKLTFAYDQAEFVADVKEFIALRIFQAYVQTLPLVSCNLAWLINSTENWSDLTFLWVVGVQILSLSFALIVSSYDQGVRGDEEEDVLNKLSKTNLNLNLNSSERVVHLDKVNVNLNCLNSTPKPDSTASTSSSSSCPEKNMWLHLLKVELNFASRLILICRIVVIAIIILHLKYWTSLLIILHFVVTFTWISFSEKMYENHKPKDKDSQLSQSHNDSSLTATATAIDPNSDLTLFLIRVSKCTYVFFWDITSNLVGDFQLWTWTLPAILVFIENLSMIIFHWYNSPHEIWVTATSFSCLVVGWLLFALLNLFSSTDNKLAVKCCFFLLSSSSSKGRKEAKEKNKDKCHLDSVVVAGAAEEGKLGGGGSLFSSDEHHHLQEHLPGSKLFLNGGDETILGEEDTEEGKSKSIIFYEVEDEKKKKKQINRKESRGGSGRKNKFSSVSMVLGKPLIKPNNYTIFSEVVLNDKRKQQQLQVQQQQQQLQQSGENQKKILMMKGLSKSPEDNPSPDSPTCYNDSGSSSNSRNTNTLLENTFSPPQSNNNNHFNPELNEDENDAFVFYYPSVKSFKANSNCNSSPFINTNTSSSTATATVLSKSGGGRGGGGGGRKKISGSSTRSLRDRKKKGSSLHSPVSSLTSLPIGYRTSTPIEIKIASKVNVPKNHSSSDGGGGGGGKKETRCFCNNNSVKLKDNRVDEEDSGTDLYERLMEDSYGILICDEGEDPLQSSGSGGARRAVIPLETISKKSQMYQKPNILPSIFHANKKLKVLCAKCLQNHDPLLTNCVDQEDIREFLTEHNKNISRKSPQRQWFSLPPTPSVIPHQTYSPSETTDYPSETEMTWNKDLDLDEEDQLSIASSHLSTATYTTWPHPSTPNPNNLSMWTTSTMMPNNRFPKEFTSLEYVRTWLLTSNQARLKQRDHPHHHNTESQIPSQINHNHHLQGTALSARKIVNKNRTPILRSKTVMMSSSVIHPSPSHSSSAAINRRKVRFLNDPTKAAVTAFQSHINTRDREDSGLCLLKDLPFNTATTATATPINGNGSTAGAALLQPPPRQKQHPALEHSHNLMIPPPPPRLRSKSISPTSARQKSSSFHQISCRQNEPSDNTKDFFKDLEIIV